MFRVKVKYISARYLDNNFEIMSGHRNVVSMAVLNIALHYAHKTKEIPFPVHQIYRAMSVL